MRTKKNIEAIATTGADILGFIFYEKSKRYVNKVDITHFDNMAHQPKKAGVFVNAKVADVNSQIVNSQLDYVQLHGDESPKYCATIKAENPNVKIIKVFSVGEAFDFSKTEKYTHTADLFLFDTKGKERGGNGIKFNWQILQEYKGKTPFLLSGGIELADVQAIKSFQHPQLWGLDVNSGFESAPGVKKANEVQRFISAITKKDN